jgi:hypothetical protein
MMDLIVICGFTMIGLILAIGGFFLFITLNTLMFNLNILNNNIIEMGKTQVAMHNDRRVGYIHHDADDKVIDEFKP